MSRKREILLRFVWLAAGALSLGAAPSASAPPQSWPLGHFVRWPPDRGSRTIQIAGVHVRVEPKRCGSDRPVSEGCAAGTTYLAVSVTPDGAQPVTLTGDPSLAQYVGIGALQPNYGRPSVILISEDGGSADCVQIDIAEAEANGYRSFRLNPDPASHGTICNVDPQALHWPADLTGDGRSEFLFWTTRGCAFTSCAGSWSVPQVVALDRGTGIDVSDDPALAPMFRANMAKALYACRHRVKEAQGPCAGYAFDAARLGILDQAWPVIDAQIGRGCRVPDEDPCAYVDRIPADFHEKLARALRRFAGSN